MPFVTTAVGEALTGPECHQYPLLFQGIILPLQDIPGAGASMSMHVGEEDRCRQGQEGDQARKRADFQHGFHA